MALALVLAPPLAGPGSSALGHSTYWSGSIALAMALGLGCGYFARTSVPALWLWLCSSGFGFNPWSYCALLIRYNLGLVLALLH